MRWQRFLLIAILCLPISAHAISGKGTTAATFLKIGVGARAVAMGEAYVAISDDVSAVNWNPSGLAQLKYPEVTAMHVFWFEDIFFDHIAWALPLPVGVAGVSLVYLNGGSLLRSDPGDTPDDPDRGSFSAADIGFTGGYGFAFNESMFLGANIVLFSETIDSQSSLGWAMDLGFMYKLPWEGLTLGAVLQNLGPATRVAEEYFRLPINFKVGLSYYLRSDILLSLDYNQLLEQEGEIALGVEYRFEEIIAIRAGYSYQGKIDNADLYSGFGTNAVSGISAGMGVYYENFRLDYAFVPYGFLGSAHRIALTYSFAPPKTTPTPQPTPTAKPTPQPTVAAPKVLKKKLEKRIQAIEKKIRVGQLASIQFKSGSKELTEESLVTLTELAEEIRQFPNLKVRIEGHTDSLGKAADNLLLSQERTEAVKAYLVTVQSLPAEQLIATGYGERNPITSNRTLSGRKKNRRVEFKVLDIVEK
jgi:outer membrane protein OmpA-like peptidoglycan-associated protein